MSTSGRHSLTPTQCKALDTISRRGPSTSGDLAELFGMRSKAALTSSLRVLVRRGILDAERLGDDHYAERRYGLTAEANRIGYRYRVRP